MVMAASVAQRSFAVGRGNTDTWWETTTAADGGMEHDSRTTLQQDQDNTPNTVVHVRGDVPYGSREYVLVPSHVTLQDVKNNNNKLDKRLILASLRAHRNVLFAAKVRTQQQQKHSNIATPPVITTDLFLNTCAPLVYAALQDAAINGEQPQALATLHGLNIWVQHQLLSITTGQEDNQNDDDDDDDHHHHQQQRFRKLWNSFTDIEQGAVQAIATGIPRPGHSVVGMGTYQDGATAWITLANEFVHVTCASTTTNHSHHISNEPVLYQATGGELVQIEHLADQQPEYLKSAGGAMARFVFF
jgi:hypothetical protein